MLVIGAVALMFAVVLVLRLATGVHDPVLVLAAVPAAVLAVEFGLIGAIIG